MIWILYVSVAVLALAFVFLVYHVAKTLRSVQSTLNNTAETISSLEKQLQGVTKETEKLLHKTNELAEEVQEKSRSFGFLFDSLKGAGQSIETLNGSIREVSRKIAEETEKNAGKLSQFVQWSYMAKEIWDKWKNGAPWHPQPEERRRILKDSNEKY